jgi:hypothetical protein
MIGIEKIVGPAFKFISEIKNLEIVTMLTGYTNDFIVKFIQIDQLSCVFLIFIGQGHA